MALLNLKEILTDAKTNSYGVLATNCFNFDSAEAILLAAEEKKSPVILMVSEALFKFFNFKRLIQPILSMVKDASVPVAVGLDHGKNFEIVMRSIKAGLTFVMYDGSNLPLEENIKIVKEITKISHVLNISVEGEVGVIGGMEGNQSDKEYKKINKEDYTKVADAVKFVEETGVDALAVAVGTIHGLFKEASGLFKEASEIDFNRISQISSAVGAFLVMHGGSDLREDVYRKSIKSGITKINYYTDLIVEANKEAIKLVKNMNYPELNYNVINSIKKLIMNRMDVFGSSGNGICLETKETMKLHRLEKVIS
ncbi:MAG: class II fructose-bisphosphate aldolase [Actinobacteria bacterium]|nr:class II fructose-bisphosphate aldolase [Actinomycetota bacterium]